MDAFELTVRLGRLFEVDVAPALAPLFTAVRPDSTEWSCNHPGDPRGAFRVSLWSSATARVDEALAQPAMAFAVPMWRQLRGRGSFHGVGAAFDTGRATRYRFWSLSQRGAGAALAGAALACEPELGPAYHLLSDVCGGPRAFRAVSLEGGDGHACRRTLYASLSSPAAAVRLLEAIGCRVTQRSRLFFRGLLGLDEARERTWPVLWVGRSVGDNAGWKFYYFARSDPDRREDRVLLDLVDAAPPVLEAWTEVARANPHARAVVQFVGLTLRDANFDAEPSWTLYLSPV